MKNKTEASLGTATRADSPQPTVHAEGHTPLPWGRQGGCEDHQRAYLWIYGADGTLVADCEAQRRPEDSRQFVRSFSVDKANARLIVTAVNHHAALVDALRSLLPFVVSDRLPEAVAARALLRKIEDDQ